MNIKKEIEAAKHGLEMDLLRTWLEANVVSITDGTIAIDGDYIQEFYLDRYNNFFGRFDERMEPPAMRKFALLLRDYIEDKKSYNGRSVDGFLICYFEQYFDSPIGLIEAMIEISDEFGEDDTGFKKWLVGNSYTTGGNATNYNRNELYGLIE